MKSVSEDDQSHVSSPSVRYLTEAPLVQSMTVQDILEEVCQVVPVIYANPCRMTSLPEISTLINYSRNAINLLLTRFCQDVLRISYLDLRAGGDLPSGDFDGAAIPSPADSVASQGHNKRKRYASGAGCSAAVVSDLGCHLNLYTQRLFSCGKLSYSRLKRDKCISIDLFMDAKSHGLLGMSSKITLASCHFSQVDSPQAHYAWLPFCVMIGKDTDDNIESLCNHVKPAVENLHHLRCEIAGLVLPYRVFLTGDYACMRQLFFASRSNYALPKGTSKCYTDPVKLQESEYFGKGRPSVWCDATPASLNDGEACLKTGDIFESMMGIDSDAAFPGMLHLASLGVAGTIADCGRAVMKFTRRYPDPGVEEVIPVFRELFRDSSGHSKLAWDIFTEEPPNKKNKRTRAFHRAEPTNVINVIKHPEPVIKMMRLLAAAGTNEAEDRLLGRVVVALGHAIDIARFLHGDPNLSGSYDSLAEIAAKGRSLDRIWVGLNEYHAPTSGVVKDSGLPGTKFLPPYCAHNIAAHLFTQHVADVILIVQCRPCRNLKDLWEFGGEHLNNLCAVLWGDAKIASMAFRCRAPRALLLLILNCWRRCEGDAAAASSAEDLTFCRSYLERHGVV